jgi:hypothetical protein
MLPCIHHGAVHQDYFLSPLQLALSTLLLLILLIILHFSTMISHPQRANAWQAKQVKSDAAMARKLQDEEYNRHVQESVKPEDKWTNVGSMKEQGTMTQDLQNAPSVNINYDTEFPVLGLKENTSPLSSNKHC